MFSRWTAMFFHVTCFPCWCTPRPFAFSEGQELRGPGQPALLMAPRHLHGVVGHGCTWRVWSFLLESSKPTPSGLVLVKKLGKNRDSIFSRCWLTVNKKISWAILAAIVPPMLDATQDGPSTSFHWFRGLEQGSKCANLRSQVEYPGNPNSIYLEISFLWKPARAVLVAAPGPVRLQAFPWCPSS